MEDTSVAPPKSGVRFTAQTACPLDCPDACSLAVTIDRGKIAKIDGSHVAPSTDGYICGKVRRFDRRVYHADRIQYPAVRTGPKGSGVFSRVAVIGGCALAKLGMKYQGHLRHGQPILEDTLVGVALLVEGDDGQSPRLRLDPIGRHTVAAGSSQKAIVEALVRDPLRALGWAFRDVDKYATELHNPELTEPSGSGDVPLLNYKVIGSLAALAREIAPAEVPGFARAHGLPGFSPTQGHIASAIPFLAHALDGLRSGRYRRTLFLAKGSLFLGRMTQMADGISMIVERNE